MDTALLVALLAFSAHVAYFSFEIWTAPGKFLKKRREARKRAYEGRLGFLTANPYAKGLDKSPQTELWLARGGFVAVYAFIIYAFFLIIHP